MSDSDARFDLLIKIDTYYTELSKFTCTEALMDPSNRNCARTFQVTHGRVAPNVDYLNTCLVVLLEDRDYRSLKDSSPKQ